MSLVMRRLMLWKLAALLLGGGAGRAQDAATTTAPQPPQTTRFVVGRERLFPIDRRLFGHFLERPSWDGENGPEEALVPGTHRLDPRVVTLLHGLNTPILRFPGGTDIDYIDWTDLIDNVPGRQTPHGARPLTVGHTGKTVSNNFGLDEFLTLCEQQKIEPLLVVNFRDGLFAKKPLAEAAKHVAALVAYCNAPLGARLPDGLRQWAALRARNGRRRPYRVRYFQIGNETWLMQPDLRRQFPADPDGRYVEALKAYVDAMRGADPSIQLIADGDAPPLNARIRREIGARLDFLADHFYTPWSIAGAVKDGQPYPAEALTRRDVWNAWVSAAPVDDATGLSIMPLARVVDAPAHGYPIAVTEWNWNGGWNLPPGAPVALDSQLAKGFGAAGMLHGLMRAGGTIRLACQSMTVGKAWGLSAINLDPNGSGTPVYRPTGQVVAFYARHHGDWMLPLSGQDVPIFAQPYRMGDIPAHAKVAVIDALVTGGDRGICLHLINRDFDAPRTVTVDLSALPALQKSGKDYVFTGRLNDAPAPGEPLQIGREEQRPTPVGPSNLLRVILPARSISCVEVPYAVPSRATPQALKR